MAKSVTAIGDSTAGDSLATTKEGGGIGLKKRDGGIRGDIRVHVYLDC